MSSPTGVLGLNFGLVTEFLTIPEPGSLLLLASGLAAYIGIRGRRRPHPARRQKGVTNRITDPPQ